MNTAPAHSPLLPQIKSILGKMGYAPVAENSELYIKTSRLGQPLSVQFYKVSNRDVQKIAGLPVQAPVAHAKFIADHARYLFG